MENHEAIVDIFCEALVEVVKTVSGYSLSLAMYDESIIDEQEALVAMMPLCGKLNGALLLSAERSVIKVICSSMIGTPKEELMSEDIEDTLRELLNMTAGGAKLRLGGSNYDYALSPPVIVADKEDAYVGYLEWENFGSLLVGDQLVLDLSVIFGCVE